MDESIANALYDLFGKNGEKEINLETVKYGFKIVVEKKIELWFLKKGDAYYYHGWNTISKR